MARIWVLTDRRYLQQRMPVALMRWLEAQGHPARLVVADQNGVLTVLSHHRPHSVWDDLEPGDLVVARSRHPLALALLREAEQRGGRSCNPWAAIVAVQDKIGTSNVLARRRVPIPPTLFAQRPEDLTAAPARFFPMLLKPVWGDNAQGIVLVQEPTDLRAAAWRNGHILAQPYLDAGGVDLKLYGAWNTVWAVRRSSPLQAPRDVSEIVPVTPTMHGLALACRQAFALRLYGIDVLESQDGPVVVDVNDFPNYTGVDEAPEAIGATLLRELDAPQPAEERPPA